MGFAFVFANVSVEQESPPTFYFILRKGQKAQERPLRCFLEFGGYIMKREGASTLFIHGFPWDLSYLLDHLLLFEIVLCVVLKVF